MPDDLDYKASVPPEPFTGYRRCYPTHEHHATALGYLCFEMASMENCLRYFFRTLLECTDETARSIFDATGVSLTGRCDLVLKVAVEKKPSEEWFDQLEKVLNHIKNAISPKRNRFVHDMWPVSGDEKVFTVDDRSFLQRQQSRASKTISNPVWNDVSLGEMWSLVRQISHATADLLLLYANRIEALHLGWPQPLREPHLQRDMDLLRSSHDQPPPPASLKPRKSSDP